MKIAMAKEIYQRGGLEFLEIVKEPMRDEWIIVLIKDENGEILKNDKGLDRKFKTIDAAYKVAKDIGFKRAGVTG